MILFDYISFQIKVSGKNLIIQSLIDMRTLICSSESTLPTMYITGGIQQASQPLREVSLP